MITAPQIVVVAESPSTRREWIEILLIILYAHWAQVSLHAEGVD